MFFSRKKFPSTETLEQEEKQKSKLYRQFVKTQNSDSLKEYFRLEKEVSDPKFKSEKEKISKLRYKGSDAYQKEREFNKLKKNRDLRNYLALVGTSQLKDFLSFKETEAFKDINDRSKLKESSSLKNHHKFFKSKHYRSYVAIDSSSTLKRYEELKSYVESEEHASFKALCNDKNRWQKTELYQVEKNFKDLASSEDIKNYLKYADSDFFSEQKTWDVDYEESFSSSKLDDQKWIKTLYWTGKLGENLYSSDGEYQAYNGQKNISLKEDTLTISTKQEPGKGKFWNKDVGFVNQDTPYTSAVLSSKNKFDAAEGLMKIKFKLSGNKYVNHSAWLGNQKNDQSILLYKAQNKQCTVGLLNKKNSTVEKNIEQVKIVPFYKDYHIMSVEWNKKEIVWKVNDLEVKKTSNTLKDSPLNLVLNSTVTDEKRSGNGEMTIDWIRTYTKKQANSN